MKQDIKDVLIEYITENQEHFYRLAYSYVREREAALDVVQNAVVRALERYDTIREPGAVKTWFYRVVVNESLRYLKRAGRELPRELEEFKDIPDREKQTGEDDLYQKIDRLPQHYKTVIVLRFFEELSLQEIAEVTGLSLSTVKYRLYAALDKLKMAMEEGVI